ncbi:hypothetical protein ECA0157_20079, partial [Escherichia coli ECA-0157]
NAGGTESFCTTDESGDAQLIPQPPVPLAAF